MRALAAALRAGAWVTLALAIVFTAVDGVLFSEGPHGFFPTAAFFGFAVLGAVSAALFAAAARLQGRPWLRTRWGTVHAGVLAAGYLTFTLLLLFR